MDEDIKEKLGKIATRPKHEIGDSEESVKINFVVPVLECFGHERFEFEYKYKDIFIKKNLPNSSKVIVETKNYDKDINKELQQLERYCNEELPLLGIIANGHEIRIFSHSWRFRDFRDRVIYCIKRENLNDENIINSLGKILSRDNLESGKAKESVIGREIEIENAENKIKEIERESKEKIEQLQAKIDELKKQIEESESEKKKITPETREQISQIWQNLGFLQPPFLEKTKKGKERKETEEGDRAYIIRYRKMLENPDTLPSRMKRYIDEEETVTYKDLKRTCVEKFGCRSETSGSIGASVKVLEEEGYIKIEGGRGNSKRIVSIKKEEEGNVFRMDKGDNT